MIKLHWQSHNFETAVSKPISLLPNLVILSKDHFQSVCVCMYGMCVCVCVCLCLCALKHTNIGSCSVWKAASREAANTARGRWREEQSKQGIYTGENCDATAALGHTSPTQTYKWNHTHTCTRPPLKANTSTHVQLFLSHFLCSHCLSYTEAEIDSCCTAVSKSTAFDP